MQMQPGSGKATRLVRGGPLFYALGRRGSTLLHDGYAGEVTYFLLFASYFLLLASMITSYFLLLLLTSYFTTAT